MIPFALTLAIGLAPQTELSSMDLTQMRAGWGTPTANRSVGGAALKIGDRTFEKGVGTHAPSEFVVDLGRKATRFEAWVGVDAETGKQGSVGFEVILDGVPAWKSGTMRGGEPAKRVRVNLRYKQTMVLRVDDAGDGIDYDHADWADAVILGTDSAKAMKAPAPVFMPVQIASHVRPEPEIHPPYVVGCTPRRPFLFRLPASGERPLRYTVHGIPAGLKIDGSQGILYGEVATAGEYELLVQVANRHGKDEKKLKIVAGDHKLALTPPMGWNSWNVWATSVTADHVQEAAEAMVSSGLADFGYGYINIDDAWEADRSPDGEILTNEKFPDMKALANQVHGLGLKLGIYSSPGPKTCGGYAGSYEHEYQDAKTYADWGIDYLKYDWCSYGQIAKDNEISTLQKPYHLMRAALDAAGRDIVFSLCQYGMGEVWKWGPEVGGDLWRTTGDITDTWSSMADIGFAQERISQYNGPSGWNDPDMLVVGNLGWSSNPRPTRLTPQEQVTHITLWSMLSAPLLIGCDMTRLDEFTKDLLMNHEVLEINQDPAAKPAKRMKTDGMVEIWTRRMEDGSTAVAFFNRGTDTAQVSARLAELGIGSRVTARNCWLREDLGTVRDSLDAKVAGHGAQLFRVWETGPYVGAIE